MVTCICQSCGAEFEAHRCHVERGQGKYCSRKCMGEARKGRPSYERTLEHRAAMSAQLKGRPATPHAVEAGAAARRGVTTSDTQKAVVKERWMAEGNPKWKGGVTRPRYGPGFFGARDLRAEVIARDKVCVDCGNWDDWPRAMHLHHLDGGRTNHSPENLVLLCRPCHWLRHTEARRAAQRAERETT